MKRISERDIIYEDNHIIAIHKPAGMLVQGDHTGDEPLSDLVKDFIKRKYNKPGNVYLGTVHRLDRPVSGIVLFAKTSKALSRLNKMFRDDQIQKTYYALLDRKPKILSATLEHYLIKDSRKNLAKASPKPLKGGKRSELSYDYVGTANHKHLIQVRPKTGRPHQIRVQLSKEGMPISGDLKYGAASGRGSYIYLHAFSLAFEHPVQREKLILHCPLPDEVNWQFFKEYENTNK